MHGTGELMTLRACLAGLVFALLLAHCGGGPIGPSVPLNEEFVVAPGDSVQIETTSRRIRFVGVISDSRCPTDVVCIQAGDAIVRIEITSAQGGELFDLHTADERPAIDGDLIIILVRLVPAPVSTRPIAPDEYRATLRVTLQG